MPDLPPGQIGDNVYAQNEVATTLIAEDNNKAAASCDSAKGVSTRQRKDRFRSLHHPVVEINPGLTRVVKDMTAKLNREGPVTPVARRAITPLSVLSGRRNIFPRNAKVMVLETNSQISLPKTKLLVMSSKKSDKILKPKKKKSSKLRKLYKRHKHLHH